MVRKILVIFLTTAVIIGGLGFYAYNSLLPLKNAANLQIDLKDMEVISLNPLQIGLQISVDNPGDRAIFPDADYDIFIEDIYIGSGKIQKTEILQGETKTLYANIGK